jgi:hypothetical protein
MESGAEGKVWFAGKLATGGERRSRAPADFALATAQNL